MFHIQSLASQFAHTGGCEDNWVDWCTHTSGDLLLSSQKIITYTRKCYSNKIKNNL